MATLPHFDNKKMALNLIEPIYQSLFEIRFTGPNEYAEKIDLLTEYVINYDYDEKTSILTIQSNLTEDHSDMVLETLPICRNANIAVHDRAGDILFSFGYKRLTFIGHGIKGSYESSDFLKLSTSWKVGNAEITSKNQTGFDVHQYSKRNKY